MNVDFSEIFTYSNITFAIAILGALFVGLQFHERYCSKPI